MKMKDQTQITNNSFSKGYGIETGSPLRIPFDVAVSKKYVALCSEWLKTKYCKLKVLEFSFHKTISC